MYRDRPEHRSFDIQHWLNVAGRRALGTLLLIATIGVSSCQALNAVDGSLLNELKSTVNAAQESRQ